jgi:ribosomal protein S18 acetylase RimI-like enzyme
MATAASFITPQVVDLRRVSSVSLGPVLEEQKTMWLQELGWDFTPSMAAIVSLVDQRELAGFALRFGNGVVGYCYYIVEDRKGIIGDLHVLEAYRTVENENLIIEAALRELMRMDGIRRVEAQLMNLADPIHRIYPFSDFNRNFQRQVMELAIAADRPYHQDNRGFPANIVPWHERMMEDAGDLMARAYANHVDSRINDQYRSAPIARRFLQNIVDQPGCGTFAAGASFGAYGSESRRMEGMSLASLVGPGMGHITQICVSPEARGKRLGYRLLESSLASLQRIGCRRVSLSVTSWNQDAVALYTRMGFVRKRVFNAAVWEGW